jgi:WD40 repeat protein
LIRNLDDGSEYVVREEFGLREVGTGRHLTVEELARSPIVQELMRRQAFSTPNSNCTSNSQSGASTPIERSSSGSSNGGARYKRRSSWLRSIRCAAGSLVTHSRDRRSSDEKDTSSEKGGHHSSSTTDDSQDSVPRHGPARVKVRQYGKSYKELSGLFMTQQIQAHNGSIWSIKFSPDGRYLASAGEDCIIHVWEVLEFEKAGKEREVKENGVCNPLVTMVCNESSETMVASAAPSGSHWEKKLRSKVLHSGGSVSSDRLMVPDYVFALSEKPVITFAGHSEDVLDLSWSKSQVMYTHF